MNYEIIELEEYDNTKATIYSVLEEGEELTLFDKFLIEYREEYNHEINDIIGLITKISTKYGVRENLVKINEGNVGDGVIALFDSPNKKLRLYGIQYGATILILGGGGAKSKSIKAYQEDPKLDKEAKIMKEISKEITQKIKDREIELINNKLVGNLNFTQDDTAL